MYLSKLEIVGFKSFAQKINLKFTGGISAVVGPNGCGKSNIVDAIRWVLGEQKTSVLRSDVMENVIFNGTKTRKPLSMSEVSLTIENNKNILPTEYNEITITRRLFRSGESEYLMNKTKCRLRDIIDLFMDTGMGADSYSVIELKMVEAILSGRAEERRSLFEEAAGIKKYKIRRKEAGRKLENVQTDLNRVSDILEEVRKNAASLSRQASKTKRYNSLMSQFKDLEVKLLGYRYSNYKHDSDILVANLDNLQISRISLENDLNAKTTALDELNKRYASVDEEHLLVSRNEREMSTAVSEKRKEAAVSSEKLISVQNSENRLDKDIEEAEKGLLNSEEALESAQVRIEEEMAVRNSLESDFSEVKQKREEALRIVQTARASVSSANEQVYKIQTNINTLNAALHRQTDKKENLERKIYQSTEETQKISNQIDEVCFEISENQARIAGLEEALLKADNELNSEKERQNSLQNESEEIRRGINDKKNALSSKNASLDFLKSLVDTNETTKFLNSKQEWMSSSESLVLAEAIGADEEHRIAVSAALSEFAGYFIVDSKENAFSAFELLKQAGKGKAGFIALNEIPTIEAPPAITQENGILGYISEIVRCDDNLKYILRGLLAATVLVENTESAENAVKSGKFNAAVSLCGTIFYSSGAVKGGSVSKNEGSRIGKKERIEKLVSEIEIINSEIEELEDNFKNLKEELALIDIQALINLVRKSEFDKKQNEQTTDKLELKKQSLENSIEAVRDNASRFSDEIAELETENERINSELSELNSKLILSNDELANKKDELESAEENQSEWDENLRNSELGFVEVKGRINTFEGEIKRLTQQIHHFNHIIEQRKNEHSVNERSRDDLSIKIETLAAELTQLDIEIEQLRVKRDFLAQEKHSLQEQIAQSNADLNDLRKAFDKTKEQIHEKDIKLSEFAALMQGITNRMAEEYEIDIDSYQIVTDDTFEPESARKEITDLKSKLAGLGNVNFMALEEFEKESERLDFYEKQVADLIESKNTLQETIAEINQTAERNFLQTFDQVHINFKMLFQKLFSEDGEAEIKIDINNPLESDIEIIAKPPNKRPNSIEQLSGGEKTLTAIALLFAIYLVKPSPFCILDEVDAPLDDANIGKFLEMIKEFSKNTQFLIVTHNKKTMAAADTLYGVTQQEVGVSKTVAVRLNQQDESLIEV